MADQMAVAGQMHRPVSAAPVRAWLFVLAALVFAMVMMGGATRLTDSGLSITEWKPVVGMVPPLSEADWLDELAKYRETHEYRTVNRGMSLDAFKVIYWWEWTHRFLGRLIGIVFVVPFVWFVWRGQVSAGCRAGSAGTWCSRAWPIASMSASTDWRYISGWR
jgi:cytochrome c oxidase assembly protein subunit 15